jgi:hypothetical protein
VGWVSWAGLRAGGCDGIRICCVESSRGVQSCSLLLLPTLSCSYAADFREEEGDAESVMVWMRVNGLNNFRKIYAIIEEEVPAGTYTVTAQVAYPTAAFGGHKLFVLSKSGPFGGDNGFLSYLSLFVGVVTLLALAGFAWLVKARPKSRKFGKYVVCRVHTQFGSPCSPTH